MSAEFTALQRAVRHRSRLERYRAHPSLQGIGGLLKRTLDVSLAGFGVLLFLPLMLMIALLIKLDSPGPVIFRQRRVGLNGREFWMYKFRSMVRDAESLHAGLLPFNEVTDGTIFKMANDPRVTRVGRWLRVTSLDEMPQLFNVLLRDMSLVGPRPLPTYEVDTEHPVHMGRLAVLPGCTGLWQVNGRSSLNSFQGMVEHDQVYIRDWSLRLDLGILWKTVEVVFHPHGSY